VSSTVTPAVVVLFDIDGTLLNTRGAGVRGMNRAFGRLHHRPDALHGVPVAGRTDRSIVTDGFRRIGIEPDDGLILALRTAYLEELTRELDLIGEPRADVLPGVVDLLNALAASGTRAVGLLTGNFETVASAKLTRYGLSDHFAFGGYGDRHLDRRDLLPVALDRARAAHVNTACARVVVVGDTPLDIDCAHAHDAMAIGVATGHYSATELAHAGADLVLGSLADDAALSALVGPRPG
jgi:phosphoglycolate phosphatase-like HAD superfamily hydrolase